MTGGCGRDKWSQDALLAAAFAGRRRRAALLHTVDTHEAGSLA
jgi:ribose transport system ATP-binding protein